MIKKISLAFVLSSLLALIACGGGPHTRGVYMLLDTSGTYTQELDKANNIISYLLATLNPGDSMAVARIDSGSFSEKDIIAKVSFDDRPSVANQQKRAFRNSVDTFLSSLKRSPYTDISGGILQGVEFLREAQVGKKTILIFSDMQEELPQGHVRDFAIDLEGVEVIALNVTKLRDDIKDPREYAARLESWRNKVEEGGGSWKVINDLDHLDRIFHD